MFGTVGEWELIVWLLLVSIVSVFVYVKRKGAAGSPEAKKRSARKSPRTKSRKSGRKGSYGKTAEGPLSDVDRLYQLIPGIQELIKSGGTQYTISRIPKRSGGFRDLHVPNEATKKVQQALYHKLFSKYRIHEAACGFVKGRSIVQNARPHLRHEVVVKLDIREFFPNTSQLRINRYFRSTGWTGKAADLLTTIVCHNQGLPQGAPTSPVISNIVNKAMDWRFAALADAFGAQYTRYADDITFSLKSYDRGKVHRLIQNAGMVCRSYGYKLNKKKKRIIRSHRRQEVTGLVVNEKINLPRSRRRWLRAIQHRLRNGLETTVTNTEYEGWMSLLKMVSPESPLLESHQQLIFEGFLQRKNRSALTEEKKHSDRRLEPETAQSGTDVVARVENRGEGSDDLTGITSSSSSDKNSDPEPENRLRQVAADEAEPQDGSQTHNTMANGFESQDESHGVPDSKSDLFYEDRLIDFVQRLKNAKPYSAEAREIENDFAGAKYATVVELESYKRTFSFKLPAGYQKGRTVSGRISDGTAIQLYFADQLSDRIEAAAFPFKGEVSIEVIQWNSTFKRIEALATGGMFE